MPSRLIGVNGYHDADPEKTVRYESQSHFLVLLESDQPGQGVRPPYVAGFRGRPVTVHD